MRTLGIDYGRARLGLAVTDAEGIVARPLPALRRSSHDLKDIAALIRENAVCRIVVGLPLHMDGTEGEMAGEARAFAARVAESTGLGVDLFDERWTSAEAERAMLEGDLSRRRRKELRDGLSAVLLLQAYGAQSAARAGEPERD